MKAEDIKGLTGLDNAQERIVHAIKKPNGRLEEVGKAVEAVKCESCGILHEVGKETYLDFIGNLHVGGMGGLLGNGNWSENGVPITYWCIDKGCLSAFLLEQEHRIKVRNTF
jgi:hypothetical protein